MSMSVTDQLGAAGYSWSINGKDRDGDAKITRQEFDLPVSKDVGGLVPADLSAGGSMDEAFDSYDRNHDGVIDQTEQKEGARPEASHPADRFSPGWNLGMSTQQALAYFTTVDKDNASLVQKWGLNI